MVVPSFPCLALCDPFPSLFLVQKENGAQRRRKGFARILYKVRRQVLSLLKTAVSKTKKSGCIIHNNAA
jgi:hypothetical protein